MDIILSTLNATYQHTAFGLRYLKSNLNEFQERSLILEFTLQKEARDIVEQYRKLNPKIIGLGVYIWNTQKTLELVKLIRQLLPDTIVVLGGPEVSFESRTQEICQVAHYTICGEGDVAFYNLCHQILTLKNKPQSSLIQEPLPDLQKIQLPYALYTDEDLQHRYIYVEASRGCPFKCEYCLSSLDTKVRNFNLDLFLGEMQKLIDSGARSFKFIDRTFKLNIQFCTDILNFFLKETHPHLFLHFEMVPDRLPEELKVLIQKFPKGSLQFEIGIQTWNPEIAKLISRRCDYAKAAENFHFLKTQTQVHIHADLIVGLPGETIESFEIGFNQLYACAPHEIQVGILKRLKGTPIIRHDQEHQMIYQDTAPFQVLQTRAMNFETLQQMNRFSRYWDLYANSGNFKSFISFLLEKKDSPFQVFFQFSLFLAQRHPQSFAISLLNLTASAWIYLTEELKQDPTSCRQILIQDYSIDGRRDIPLFLKDPNTLKPQKNKPNTNSMDKPNHTPLRQRKFNLQK